MSAVTYYQAGARLRKARKARGLLQWEVARKAGITAPALSMAETGQRPLSVQTAAAVAPVVGLSALDLTVADPARPVSPLPAAPPGALTVRSHRDIPGACPCDWQMQFRGRQPAGWALARPRPGCAHYRQVTG